MGLRRSRQSLQRVVGASREINQVHSLSFRGYYYPDDSAIAPESGRPVGRRGEEQTVRDPHALAASSSSSSCPSPTCPPGLPPPLLWALSPLLLGATLNHLGAVDLLLRELSPLLKVRDPTQFLSPPPQLCQACQPKVAPRNTGPASRKKSQEKKPNLRRAFPHKKHGPEEPKRAGTADVSSPDSRPPKRPSYLFLCVGGHRPSNSSSRGEQIVTIATLQLPPALEVSPGLELATLRTAIPILTFALP